ncbi:MAG TPA: hypothetical protein VHU80_09380 [Polyangiaceae bacterium]|nr:hypothetical protein [Polyangiaceae bacterium]
MSHTMNAYTDTMNGSVERAAAARRVQSLVRRAGLTLAMAAVWGFAAGSAKPMLALLDVYKVPMVLSLSLVVALPAVLVARRLLGLAMSPVALLTAIVTGLERGALVLIAFAPLLAVYAYTSHWVSPVLAQWSAGLALLCGLGSLVSELVQLPGSKGALVVLSLVTAVMLGLSLVQLISLATPVLPVHTVFGAGIDGMMHR